MRHLDASCQRFASRTVLLPSHLCAFHTAGIPLELQSCATCGTQTPIAKALILPNSDGMMEKCEGDGPSGLQLEQA